jgi:hypothetical protein
MAEVRMPWEMRINPRAWVITQGQWSQESTLIVGASVSVLVVLISILLDRRAWDVESSYLLWTWIGITTATWAVVWNAAWAVGAVRCARRLGRRGESVWKISQWLLASLMLAILAAGMTLSNSKVLVESWWIMLKEGDPPVKVAVTSTDDEGRAQRLLISGGIGMGSTKALRAMLDLHPDVLEVELDSPGGMAVEGFGMTNLLLFAGVRTVVTNACASACTIMFMAGDERVIGAKGRLGYHRSYSITGDFGSGWNEVDFEMAQWMKLRGASDEFIRRALDTPGWDLWVPSHADLLASGVATARDIER